MPERGEPWWVQRALALLKPASLGSLDLGHLWELFERIAFVHENVEPELLLLDFEARPELRPLWTQLTDREAGVDAALDASGEDVAHRVRSGALGPALFREAWEGLGFAEAPDRASTAADDWLDGLMRVTRLTTGPSRPPFGQVNLASRARKISDFLGVVRPASVDTVYDLGCGSGKVAVTLAASSTAHVKGVEYGEAYVEAARRNGARLGLENLELVHADVRDVDLSDGTAFYLFYPFWGEVARSVAQALGELARSRSITVYASGPVRDFGEYFLELGALRLVEKRGDHGEVLVLRSAGS